MLLKIHKKSRRVFFSFLAIALLPFAIYGIFKLHLDTDVFKLMPEGNKIFEGFKKSVKYFGGIDNVIVFMNIPDLENLENYLLFTEDLCEDLQKIEKEIAVFYHPPDPKPYLEFFLKNLIVLSNDEEWQEFLKYLDKEKMEKTLKETKFELTSVLDPEVKNFLLLDPLKFHRIYWERFNIPIGSFKIDYLSGYFLSEDHSSLLIILKPKGTAQDINYSTQLVLKVEKLIKDKISEWEYQSPPPEMEVGGGFKIAVEDARIIKNDIFFQITTSLLLVLFLYYLSFRNLKTVFFPLIILGLGMVFTFGFAGWFLKELNISSSAFAALLVGLGIDFVILIYSRFLEERKETNDLNKIFYSIEKDVYPSIFLGAITTVGTFGVFYFTKLKGLKELGILTSIGILWVMFFSFTILPILFIFEKKIEGKEKSLYNVFLFFIDFIIKYSVKKRYLIIFLSLIILGISSIFIKKIPFQDNAEALRSKENIGIIVQNKISSKFGKVGYPSITLIEDDDLNNLILIDEELSKYLDKLKEKDIVFSHQGISNLLPSLSKQEKNLKRASEVDFKKFKENFLKICNELNLNAEAFQSFLNNIEIAFNRHKVLSWENLTQYQELIKLNNILFKEDKKYHSFRSIYFPDGKYKREPPKELEEFVSIYPEITLTGVNAMAKELRLLIKKDAFIATVVGAILVFFILFLFFKNIKKTIHSFIPLIFGISFLLGLMGILKIPFNSMNIFVVLMIIGIGTDYGIHIIHRYELSKGNLDKLSYTGGAVLFSALTTVAGFGSLILSHFLGLKSMGFVAIFGTLFVLLFTLTLLPAILKKTNL